MSVAIQPQPIARAGGGGSGAGDRALRLATGGSALVVLLLLAALVFVLFLAAIPSFRTFGLKFLVDPSWSPAELPARDAHNHIVYDAGGDMVMNPPHFGALAFIRPRL